MYSRQDIFARVDIVLEKQNEHADSTLDPESLYYLLKLHRRFQQNGCGISDERQRNEFKVKMMRLADLVRQCNQNLSEDASGIWLTQDALEGLPQSLTGRMKCGEGEHSEHLWLSTKTPFSIPAMRTARNETTRKKIHYTVQNRMMVNIPLFREIILLRDETARMLGYPNHATYKIADKMMQTPRAVEALLSEIRTSTAPLASRDAEELLEMKRLEAESRGDNAEELYLWDIPYYYTRRSEKERPTEESISEYYELNNTLAKLLKMFENLFGARFKRIDVQGRDAADGPLVWHQDVHMYSVWNIDGSDEPLGYAYLDFFPRDGKYTHAGNYPLQKVSFPTLVYSAIAQNKF